jgi:hypothetical protein
MALLEEFRDLRLEVEYHNAGLSVSRVNVKNLLLNQIKEAQESNLELQKLKNQLEFSLSVDRILMFQDRVCVPDNESSGN